MATALTAEELAQEAMALLVDSANGIYVPQRFVQNYNHIVWGISPYDAAILSCGPDHEHYWDTWEEVWDKAEHTDDQGHKHTLYCHEGDVFALDNTMVDEWEAQTGRCFWDEYGE